MIVKRFTEKRSRDSQRRKAPRARWVSQKLKWKVRYLKTQPWTQSTKATNATLLILIHMETIILRVVHTYGSKGINFEKILESYIITLKANYKYQILIS